MNVAVCASGNEKHASGRQGRKLRASHPSAKLTPRSLLKKGEGPERPKSRDARMPQERSGTV